MTPRFFVPESLDQPQVRLEGGEAHHLLHVLRLGTGDEVIVFDGQGGEAVGRVALISKSAVEVELLERRSLPRETTVPVTLATAVPKGERFDWLVEKATELGVSRLIPLNTERSVVDAGAGKIERLRRSIIAASKQCGRSRLMELAEPLSWNTFVETELPQGETYIADPSGDHCEFSSWHVTKPVILAVGPEGGFTEDELEIAGDAGGRLISLGPRILRIETAAVALAALFTLGVDQ